MLTPTLIYVEPALEVLGRCEVHGIGHVTGGLLRQAEEAHQRGHEEEEGEER